ncbi:RraA family protein [Nocardia sp. NPDC004278]|uniref:RraA family protein n=1 Tax=Nocardia sp. NPDC004604 TaxID=3157013 RepID=UPI0033BB22CF
MTGQEGTDVGVRSAGLSSATLHEAAGRVGALPAVIRPVHPDFELRGPAYPVACTPGHNLWIHRAVYAAPAGSILVVNVGDGVDYGYWGEVLAVAAVARGLRGLVINGGVRDATQLAAMNFPVFSAAVTLRGTGKDPRGAGSLGEPVAIGEVTVHAGDLVVGDADGVVVIPAERVAEVVAASHRREADEAAYMDRLRAGESTMAIYGLPEVTS